MDDESNVRNMYMVDTKAHLLFIIQFHFSNISSMTIVECENREMGRFVGFRVH
jgi:hypothetical protein